MSVLPNFHQYVCPKDLDEYLIFPPLSIECHSPRSRQYQFQFPIQPNLRPIPAQRKKHNPIYLRLLPQTAKHRPTAFLSQNKKAQIRLRSIHTSTNPPTTKIFSRVERANIDISLPRVRSASCEHIRSSHNQVSKCDAPLPAVLNLNKNILSFRHNPKEQEAEALADISLPPLGHLLKKAAFALLTLRRSLAFAMIYLCPSERTFHDSQPVIKPRNPHPPATSTGPSSGRNSEPE